MRKWHKEKYSKKKSESFFSLYFFKPATMPSPDPGALTPNWVLVMLDKSRTKTEPSLGDPKARNSNPIQIVKKPKVSLRVGPMPEMPPPRVSLWIRKAMRQTQARHGILKS
jgi:hypothetical protein